MPAACGPGDREDMSMERAQDIRIGTLVGAGMKSAEYIRQILPHGFECFSLTFWQTTKGVQFRTLADEVKRVLDGSGAVISTLSIFGNPLGDEPKDKESLQGWKDCIDAAALFGCDLVTGFTGRVRGKPIPESLPVFKKVYKPLAERARDKGVRLAVENCSMGGNWGSGDWNIAHHPEAWEMMFDAVPADNLGLEWEPCHQMVALIDPMPQLRQWVRRIFHLHGKDATILWDVVRSNGVGGSRPFAFHRTPGFGDSNWTDIISELRRGGFRGSIDIEGWHDPVMRGDLEMTGQVHAVNHLKRCRGGAFVPNPVV
jgi:sugar phosphate isomerase/epimerase